MTWLLLLLLGGRCLWLSSLMSSHGGTGVVHARARSGSTSSGV